MYSTPILDVFRRHLAEVIAWCTVRASVVDPANCLRTPMLQPADIREPPAFTRLEPLLFLPQAERALLKSQRAPIYKQIHAERQAIMDALNDERARYLQLEHRFPTQIAHDVAGGQLLLYYCDGTVGDGASELATHGFFDVLDSPPWDTWVCYGYDENEMRRDLDSGSVSYIISWVPPTLIELADGGITVNPVAAIAWAADVDIPFVQKLRAVGLV